MRAIDLYSGVGGWSLGLKLAGVDVIASYERWGAANETNFKNNRHQAQTVDIRSLELDELPDNVDIVVGSPPCTQFSFANRGGGGDLNDGLQDIIKFLTIVKHVRPQFWAMENVPRVAGILERELKADGALEQFLDLQIDFRIIDMAEYGVPQKRKRCIAGNINFSLLESYKKSCVNISLGDVVRALKANIVCDPLYGLLSPQSELFDHIHEEPLNYEEGRINHAAKQVHPVYNSMPFPDPMDRPVRTITATCTRVSRESVIIKDGLEGEACRRLTLRERASLQGFPITFQFFAPSYGQKLKMIGNAVPPPMAYLIAMAMQGASTGEIPPLSQVVSNFTRPASTPKLTYPDKAGRKYPPTRKFRFSIPSLRLKSGVRFDIINKFFLEQARWGVTFTFGNSKNIHTLNLDEELLQEINVKENINSTALLTLDKVKDFALRSDINHMQNVWSHSGPGGTRPFDFLDTIDVYAKEMIEFGLMMDEANYIIQTALHRQFSGKISTLKGVDRLFKNALTIASGILIGCQVNSTIGLHCASAMRRDTA